MAKRTRASQKDRKAAKDATPLLPMGETGSAEELGGNPPPDRRLAWLDRMRPFRARRERDVSVDGVLHALERQLRAEHDALGDLIDAWNAVVPQPLRGAARIVGVTQGTMTVAVATSGASYELSRALRGGLEGRLLEKLPARVRRIKVKVVADA